MESFQSLAFRRRSRCMQSRSRRWISPLMALRSIITNWVVEGATGVDYFRPLGIVKQSLKYEGSRL
jgi:hypothetical protein